MQNYTDPFESGFTYHVYNRAIGNDLLFFEKRNYLYFLSKLKEKTAKYIDIIAYCLLENHYHLLIQVKEHARPKDVSEGFRTFGISYSQAINKQENRKGSLFMRPVKRKRVVSDSYFRNLIVYIHTNPIIHGYYNDFENYPWSSYKEYIGQTKTEKIMLLFNNQDFLQEHFGDVKNFKFVHKQKLAFKNILNMVIEE